MRRWIPFVALAVGLVVLGVVRSSGGTGGTLDPNGTGPSGAKALVELLRQYGARVELTDGVPSDPTATALVLVDELDADRRTALATWVTRGGHLVVADPGSDLQVGAATVVDRPHPTGPCALPGLASITTIDVGPSLFLRGDGTGCFPDVVTRGATTGTAWFLLATPRGKGTVIGLGGAGLWTNQRLDHDGNAALAVALLAPTPSTAVAVLTPSRVGSGHTGTSSLISPRVRSVLWQLLIAFGVLAWWRGRRLGRPIDEPQPVQLPAAEIVSAVGSLLQRTRGRAAAAGELRRSTRRWLAGRLGLDPDAPTDALRARGVVDRGALDDAVPPDDEALVRLAQSLAHLREEVSHGAVR